MPHTLEEDTRLTRWFEPVIMPGLLQTPDYMRAMLGKVAAFYGHDEPVDDGIAARLERQHVLRHGNHRFNFVLAEQVLYTTVGSDDVMIGQLDHLLDVMRLPNVVVSVVPAMSDYQVPTTNFAIFDRKVAFCGNHLGRANYHPAAGTRAVRAGIPDPTGPSGCW